MIVRTVVFNNKSADRFSKASPASSRCPCSRQVNIIPSPRCRPIEGRILPNWGIDISSLAEKEAAQHRPCSLVLVFVDLIHQGYTSCGLRIDTGPVVFQKEKIDLAMAKAFHIPGVSRRGLPRHVLYSKSCHGRNPGSPIEDAWDSQELSYDFWGNVGERTPANIVMSSGAISEVVHHRLASTSRHEPLV